MIILWVFLYLKIIRVLDVVPLMIKNLLLKITFRVVLIYHTLYTSRTDNENYHLNVKKSRIPKPKWRKGEGRSVISKRE